MKPDASRAGTIRDFGRTIFGRSFRGGADRRPENGIPPCAQSVMPSLIDRLDDELVRRLARDDGDRVLDRLRGRQVHVLAGRRMALSEGFTWLAGHGAERTTWMRDLDALSQAVMEGPAASMAVVDLDLFQDRSLPVELFASLRAFRPGLVVIFGSKEFRGHDFDTCRAAICDASLRLPASRAAFVRAVDSALDNHGVARGESARAAGRGWMMEGAAI